MFKSIQVASSKAAVPVIAVTTGMKKLPEEAAAIDDSLGGQIKAALKTPGFNADKGQTLPVRGDAVLFGLGAGDDLSLSTIRSAGASLSRALDRMEIAAATVIIGDALANAKLDDSQAGQAFGEGLGIANWRVDFFDGSATDTPAAHAALKISSTNAKFRSGLRTGLTLADGVNYARRLGATPPNVCNPKWVASEARKLARSTGLKATVLAYADLQKHGMGGLINVGKGSGTKPALVILEHKPQKPARGVRVALVGKTITFDTGGYSMKTRDGMKGMKYDKNGGVAVFGAMRAIADLDLPVHTIALLPAAENMVSGDAYRPDDIITMYNGVTVEVTNTDAEGRLVLADALAYACKHYKPTTIIDMATLTGGIVTALGHFCAGLFCNDDALIAKLSDAADATGEKLWRMPLWEDHREFMRARHADIWNSGPSRNAHPIQGAAFLSYFVDESIPWAHIDIAGVSAVDSETDMYVPGPTGFGVRLLAEAVGRLGSKSRGH